jgi:hypothetical protein
MLCEHDKAASMFSTSKASDVVVLVARADAADELVEWFVHRVERAGGLEFR